MKKIFGYLFAILAVSAFFACNDENEDDNKVVNDSQFVGVWKMKSLTTSTRAELLDSVGVNVIKTTDVLKSSNQVFTDATIEFKEDYTALSIIRDGGNILTGGYKWADLNDKLAFHTYTTYEKVVLDTMNINKSGNTITLTTTRKKSDNYTETFEETVEEEDTTYIVTRSKTYPARMLTDVTIVIEK